MDYFLCMVCHAAKFFVPDMLFREQHLGEGLLSIGRHQKSKEDFWCLFLLSKKDEQKNQKRRQNMGQDICSRKDEKPLGYDWECGHEELYVRVNMYYNGSLYVGLWQKQKECEKKLELFGDLTIGVMGFLRPGQAIISDCGAKAKVAFIEKYKLGKVVGKRKINYGSYYVVEFNLARLAQLDPEGTERYLLENGLDQKELKAD